jgi:hypothetical protein
MTAETISATTVRVRMTMPRGMWAAFQALAARFPTASDQSVLELVIAGGLRDVETMADYFDRLDTLRRAS